MVKGLRDTEKTAVSMHLAVLLNLCVWDSFFCIPLNSKSGLVRIQNFPNLRDLNWR